MTAALRLIVGTPEPQPDPDLTWQQQGACNGVDPDLFFPERGEPTEPAKAVCADCHVRTECLDYALDNREMHGIWGGMSERERRRIRRQRLAANGYPARPCAHCGTTFKPNTATQKYDTRRCADAAHTAAANASALRRRLEREQA